MTHATTPPPARPPGRRPPTQVTEGKPSGLGTFGGVYTPSILTILGVIMYLRFGWVVGNVGLWGTLLIVTLSTAITFLTALSISAIATDQRVRIGGAYYMISRSLGIESGGAVGIPLYFAQALSVALYTIGFAESLANAFPGIDQRTAGLVTTVLVAGLALLSARAAIRAQYVIMAAIALSLLSFFFGHPLEPDPTAAAASFTPAPFWQVFAVFFPAVTGIMAGVNMSGDLRDPARSIPRGTLAAVGTGYLIYMALPVLLAMRADPATLIADPLVMRRMALWGDAILLGVWGATLSSAVGSMLGAPRVLQALARDGVLPRPLRLLGRGSGPSDEPRIGTIVTLAVALAAVALGNLNVIAPVLTMFFLTTYAVLNIAAGIERALASPSFRPTFRVHWLWSLLGALGCVAVMVLINALATVVALLVVAGIYVWLQRRELRTAWGDVRQGIWLAVVRAGLLRLKSTSEPKTWRPHMIVLSGAPTRRWHLIELASALSHNRSLVTVATVLTANGNGAVDHEAMVQRDTAMANTIREYLEQRGIEVLVRVVRAPDPFVGAERLVASYGLGPLVPNTVLMGDSEEADTRDRYCRMIANFYRAKRNVVIVRYHPERGFGGRRRIDVWWGGLKGNGGLMMTLAYLLKTSLDWKNAEVRLKMVVPTEAALPDVERNLRGIVAQLRSEVIPEVLVADGRPFAEILRTSSRDADLVFLGVKAPDADDAAFAAYYQRLQGMIDGLPTTALVLAAEDLAFGEIIA